MVNHAVKQWVFRNKSLVLLLFSVVVLALLCSTLTLSESVDSLGQSQQLTLIEDELFDEGEVRVLVVLEDNSQTISSHDGLREAAIEEKQEEFIEELRQDVDLNDEEIVEFEQDALVGISSLSEEELTLLEEESGSDDSVRLEVMHEFETLNAVSVTVHDEEVLDAIVESSDVAAVYYDYPVSVSLDSSTSQITADELWPTQLSGLNLTGQGESVCVVDTGIDYTHHAFGSCNPVRYSVTGTVETLSSPVESDHDYANSEDITYTITQPGYESIAVHFDQIGLENQTYNSGTVLDRIYVLGGDNQTVAVYKGNHTNIWSPHVPGDTISIRLVSDPAITDYGFLITQVVNGTTNTTMDWDSCPSVVGGYDVYNGDPDPFDDNFHGTHVSGIVASRNTTYSGVAPGASLVALKALNSSGGGFISDVTAAIEWCHSNADELNISVIGLSLGCAGSSCTHHRTACDGDLAATAISNAASDGIATVIATGNGGWTDGISNPSCVSSAIPVGSVTSSDVMSSFTNRGNLLELLGPGSSITSTTPSNTWSTYSGTSMATPHVAGAIALMQQYWQAAYGLRLSPSALESRLASTGVLVEDSASGNNYSRIDVLAAISPSFTLSDPNPANASYVTNGSTTFNVSTDLDLSAVDLIINWSNTSTTHVALSSENQTQFSGQVDAQVAGAHSYYFVANSSVLDFNSPVYEFSVTSSNSSGGGGGNSSAPEFASHSFFPAVIYGNSTVTFTANITDDTGLDNSSVVVQLEHSSTAVNYSLVAVSKGFFEVNVSNSSVFVPGLTVNASFYVTDLSSHEVQSNLSSFSILNNDLTLVNITEPTTGSILELNETVTFSAQATDPDGQELTFSWDFGDASLVPNVTGASSVSINHSFVGEGNFSVQVTANDFNSSVSDSQVLIVNDSLAPLVKSISYVSSVDLASNSSQELSVIAQDASGLTNISLYYLDELITSSSLGETNLSAVNFGNFTSTVSGLNFTLELTDNSSNNNVQNLTYNFDVIDTSSSSSSSDSSSAEQSSSAPFGSGGGGGGGGGGSPASSSSTVTTSSVSQGSDSPSSQGNSPSSEQVTTTEQSDSGSPESIGQEGGDSSQGFFSRVFSWISSLFNFAEDSPGQEVPAELESDAKQASVSSNALTAAAVTDFVDSIEFDERSVSIAVLLIFIVVLFGLYVAFKPEEE